MSFSPDNRRDHRPRPAGDHPPNDRSDRGSWGDGNQRRNWNQPNERPPNERYQRDFPRSPSPKRRKMDSDAPEPQYRRRGTSPPRGYGNEGIQASSGSDLRQRDDRGPPPSYSSASPASERYGEHKSDSFKEMRSDTRPPRSDDRSERDSSRDTRGPRDTRDLRDSRDGRDGRDARDMRDGHRDQARHERGGDFDFPPRLEPPLLPPLPPPPHMVPPRHERPRMDPRLDRDLHPRERGEGFSSSSSNREGSQPNREGHHQPNREGYQPNREGSQSNRDGYQPNREGSQSNREGHHPNREGNQPNRGDGYNSSHQTAPPRDGGFSRDRDPHSRTDNSRDRDTYTRGFRGQDARNSEFEDPGRSFGPSSLREEDVRDFRDRRMESGPNRNDRIPGLLPPPPFLLPPPPGAPPFPRPPFPLYDRYSRNSPLRPSSVGDISESDPIQRRNDPIDQMGPPFDLPPRDRDSSLRDSRDSSTRDTRDSRGDSGRDLRRSEQTDPPRRENRDFSARDPPRDTSVSARDYGREEKEYREREPPHGERRRPDFVPRDSNRMMRNDPGGGRPPLEHRQHHRPSILGGGGQPNFHQRPSITAPMQSRQFDSSSRRMDSYSRSHMPNLSMTSFNDSKGSNNRQSEHRQNTSSPSVDLHDSDASVSGANADSIPPTSTTPEPNASLVLQSAELSTSSPAPILPSKTEILLGIEDREDSIVEVSKQVERLRKEREQLAKEIQSFENTKNRGKLLHLVPGLPIRPEILTTSPADLIRETYEHNLRLSNRASSTIDAQLWDASTRPNLAPFLNYLTSTSKQFQYMTMKREENGSVSSSGVASASPSPPPQNGSTTHVSLTPEPNHEVGAPEAMETNNDSSAMQVDGQTASSSPQLIDPDFLPLDAKPLSPPEIDESVFFEPVESPDVSDYSFVSDNVVLHEQLRDLMIASLQEKRAEAMSQAQKSAKEHRKVTALWLRQLQMEREEEATRKLLQNKKWLYVAQSGRKSSVRVSTRATDLVDPGTPGASSSGGGGGSSGGGGGSGTYGMNMSGRRRMMSSSGSGGAGGSGAAMDEEYDEEEDEDRFESTRADVPPMLQFDEDADDHRYHDMVDNNGVVEDSRRLDQDIKILRPWHADEEDVFVRAFLRFHKDFLKIQSYLPGKSLQEIIWFYYTRKNKLDLKRRWQREGINQLQLLNLGLSALTPSDPAAATLAHYMGSAVEWVNGTSRRGSLRLLEKGGPKPPPTGTAAFPPSGPVSSLPGLTGTPAAGSGYPSERHSARLASFEDSDVDIERSLHDSGNYSPGRPTSTSGEGQNRWTAEEREKFKLAFDVHYKDFKAIADIMRTKNAAQCKNYYHNNKKKLGLPSGALGRSGMTATPSDSKPMVGSSSSPPPPSHAATTSKSSTLNSSDMDVDSSGLDVSVSASTSLHTSSVTIYNTNTTPLTTVNDTSTQIGIENFGETLELASPTPKRGAAARINTSHWTDEEKSKFKSLLQIHGKDWKALAAGIPSKTVNQIKNFFQNYRTKLKLDDLLPESDRNATSSRGGRGKKRKIKPRGRPKKSGSGDGSGFGGDDDGSDYLEESDGGSGMEDEDSGYEDLKTSSEYAAPSGVGPEFPDVDDNAGFSRASSGKRRNTEALENVELDILNDSTTGTAAIDTLVEDLPYVKEEATFGTQAVGKRGGRGGSGRGRGRGRGASSAASAPPVKKRKLKMEDGDDQDVSLPGEASLIPLEPTTDETKPTVGSDDSLPTQPSSSTDHPLPPSKQPSSAPSEVPETFSASTATPSIRDTLNALDTLSTLSQFATPAAVAQEERVVSSELLELKDSTAAEDSPAKADMPSVLANVPHPESSSSPYDPMQMDQSQKDA